MPGDHQFLVGRDHPCRHFAGLAGDARRFSRVRVFVELDAEPRRRRADSFADLRRVLADACGEDEAVDSAERRRHRRDFLCRAIDEVVECQARGRLAAREQTAHVVADARDADQPGLLVENGLDVFHRQAESLEEIEDDARVECAWPRSHAETVQRREAECAVDALSVFQRTQACAAAKVSDDDPPGGNLGRDRWQHRRDVLVRKPVESVALDARIPDLTWQRNELGYLGLATMKAGIEAHDLRHSGQTLPDRFDRREVVRLMKRRERDQRAKLLERLLRHDRRPGVLRAAMHDAMTNADDVCTRKALAEPVGDEAERGLGVTESGIQRRVGDALTGAVLCRELRLRAETLDLTARVCFPRVCVGLVEDRELQARRPGVDDDGVVVHGRHTAS